MAINMGAFLSAIKDQESGGNYDAYNGDSGARGAYQFIPSTWSAYADRAGVDPNDWSPATQDKVAYTMASEYADMFNGDDRLMAQAWYGGPGNVGKDVSGGEGYPSNFQYGDEVHQKYMNYAGNGGFTYQAKDASGKPFLNLSAYIRTSNPNEKFDQQGIMSILGQQGPSLVQAQNGEYFKRPNFEMNTLAMPADVAKYVQPYAKQLNAMMDAELQNRVNQQAQQQKLGQMAQLAQLINSSNNVDNRRAYAAMGKMFGFNMPDGADQFVNSGGLLEAQNKQIESERNYTLKRDELNFNKDIENKKLQLEAEKIAAAREAAASGGGRRGYSGGGSGGGKISTSDARSTIEIANKWDEDHPGQEWANPFAGAREAATEQVQNAYGDGFISDTSDYRNAYHNAQIILEDNARNGYQYTPYELEDAISAVTGEWGPKIIQQYADDGTLARYGR